jgi:hypothetical protein
MNIKLNIIILFTALLPACAAVKDVKPVEPTFAIQHVCIQENPKVVIGDFLQVLRDGFDRHGISTEAFKDTKPSNCEHVVTYVAHNRWEWRVFLSDAEIRIEKDGRYVASASLHYGKWATGKDQTTKEKIEPLIDEMLRKRSPM